MDPFPSQRNRELRLPRVGPVNLVEHRTLPVVPHSEGGTRELDTETPDPLSCTVALMVTAEAWCPVMSPSRAGSASGRLAASHT